MSEFTILTAAEQRERRAEGAGASSYSKRVRKAASGACRFRRTRFTLAAQKCGAPPARSGRVSGKGFGRHKRACQGGTICVQHFYMRRAGMCLRRCDAQKKNNAKRFTPMSAFRSLVFPSVGQPPSVTCPLRQSTVLRSCKRF